MTVQPDRGQAPPSPPPADQPAPGGPAAGPRGKGLVATLGNIKDILTNVYGIIAVAGSILTSFGLGAAVGHVATTATPAPAPTVTVVRTVPAAPPSNGPAATPSPTATDQPTSAPNPTAATSLSLLKPLQNNNAGNIVIGPVQIGTTPFPQSVRFNCTGGYNSYVVYNVAGFAFLDATVGVPNDATNAAGNTATIGFLKNGSTTQLSPPIADVIGQPQKIHLNLQGSAQLEITCNATSNANHNAVSMDIALGDATLTP
ncbi:hypothetical protein ABIA33_003187 [Streptacidiphilus sp. MAP12-16]|uniref:hypothetical protein n=1 Tax=Streptacidiphilus sp. MAP12-16 TaxID=3156300 RepID=UPI003519B7F4